MHVEQGHIHQTKKGLKFLYAMSASAREFCEEQRKNPSAGTIKRRQAFEARRVIAALGFQNRVAGDAQGTKPMEDRRLETGGGGDRRPSCGEGGHLPR